MASTIEFIKQLRELGAVRVSFSPDGQLRRVDFSEAPGHQVVELGNLMGTDTESKPEPSTPLKRILERGSVS